MRFLKASTFALLTLFNFSAMSQEVIIKGNIINSETGKALDYVNIGIAQSKTGTVSLKNGRFSITIPTENRSDVLTFSRVGYTEQNLSISKLTSAEITIRLVEKILELKEVVISGKKLVERKYGIKKRGLIHFTDGIFNKDDSFEIGQVIKLGNKTSQITSVNLHLNSSRQDSASFRINFYRFNEDNNRPGARIIEKNILQRHPIKEGWLKFDLTKYNILLKGAVFISLEFIPENKSNKKINYEVKLGGASKSFFRRNSLGQWSAPPHHYCLYATALTDKDAPEEVEADETTPTTILKSDSVKQPYSVFVRLPKDYHKNTTKKYPVIYHVDGNAFFDVISSSTDRLFSKKKISEDPIIVGIGYENAYVMDSLRDRDYTFPKSNPQDSFPRSGGGELFYQFFKTKVEPYIQKTYRTDTTNRTIMGHSLGGYFALYTLLRDRTEKHLFNNYVAASPSIYYHNDYIAKQFLSLRQESSSAKKIKLYLTWGEKEINSETSERFNYFRNAISKKDIINLKLHIYENMEHMSTAVPSFEDGIEFVLKR